MERTVLCSVVDDGFAAGFVVMERSLRHHNPDWTMPVIAIDSADAPLSAEARAVIREHCDNVHFARARPAHLAPVQAYARDVIGTPERLWPALAVLEALSWDRFDRVIALDSDLLIRGSLEPLLHAPANFNAVRARHAKLDMPMGFFNTGVMVLHRPLLLGFEVARIPDYLGGRRPVPGTGLADQAVLNMLMPHPLVGWMPERLNFTKRSLAVRMRAGQPEGFGDPGAIDAWLAARDVAVVHYVGEKPWNPKIRAGEKDYAAAEALWHAAAARFGGASLFRHMQRQSRLWTERYAESLAAAAGPEEERERQIARAMGL
ncbi:hypothetical protein [Pseudoruegeria sp. HB172150]|uniref:hypothetical protein n=1 Tax=Pseudoruegeria sp. HB172150 TaxID=2721164 RepID=UPI0015565151|nr:hypothetical protein [Pseudoruegeria sp. HB172150]